MRTLKERAISLRVTGKTFSEICTALGRDIPKSTLSYWCKAVILPELQLNRIERKIATAGSKGLATAHARHRNNREKYLKSLHADNLYLRNFLFDKTECAKAVLAALYLAEGGKTRKGSLMFGNSDPRIITLFLKLLRQTYVVDNSKFRCTLLCRADQNTKSLESFWVAVTNIPKKQFYEARIDSRTIGKKSRKANYKGVCRIDYFSAQAYNDLLAAGDVLTAAD